MLNCIGESLKLMVDGGKFIVNFSSQSYELFLLFSNWDTRGIMSVCVMYHMRNRCACFSFGMVRNCSRAWALGDKIEFF
jgi:hypothetical protein